MIASIEDIKSVRDISRNLSPERIEPFIEEVEHMYVVPAIGAERYEGLTNGSIADDILTDGGYYTKGTKHLCYGLKKAIAYFAYARICKNNGLNVTAYGITQKTSNYSSPTPDNQISEVVEEATKMGNLYLQSCVDYLKATEQPTCKSECVSRKPFGIEILN